ncbi:MAG: Rdx family protein [Planctomycetes bacterium]|nr:Rdx family protein [Planctomycetota bacterium]
MGAAIRAAIPGAKVEQKPGGRGDFVVTADGKRIWDKRKQDDQFPEPGAIVAMLRGK